MFVMCTRIIYVNVSNIDVDNYEVITMFYVSNIFMLYMSFLY